MEGACLYALKSGCSCLVSQAASSAAKEMSLQEGVKDDAMFLAEELEEMNKFLADVGRDGAGVLAEQGGYVEDKAFVKKIQDMACDIEDCLLDLAPHRERPSMWRLPLESLASRHAVAAELKDLVSQVGRVSQRRERYRRARERALRKPTTTPAPAEEEARPVVPEIDWRVDLGELIARADESLVVISVWLMKDRGSERAISLVGEVYDAAKEFQCRAWVTAATHPISLTEFLRALARQFLGNDPATSQGQGALGVLADTETMGAEQLMAVVARHLDERRYLVVVEDVCTRPEWDWIKLIFPDHRNGSRVMVTSRRADVARHCAERSSRSFNLELVPDGGARLYVSSDKGGAASRGFSEVIKIEPYSEFVGRNEEVEKLTRWISLNKPQCAALSVYGASGIGKSTLVRNVYNSTELLKMFHRRAWIAMVHPFNKEEFLRDTISQFKAYRVRKSKSGVKNKSCDDLVTEVCQLMGDGRSLLVVDGLSAEEQWDQVKSCFWTEFGANSGSCTVIVTTTSAAVATHCSGNSSSLMFELSPLNSASAHQLFYQKVFRRDRLIELCKPMVDHANFIIRKCDGNLRAISIISGLLATKTRTSTEWEKLLNRFDMELKNNPDLGVTIAAAKLSYDDLPSHMKYLVQYLSFFPRSYNIMLRRLAKAWLAETYRRNAIGDTTEEVEDIFDALVMRSMVHPSKRAEITSRRINGCHVDDVFRQLSLSEAKSRGFIDILDEHMVSNNLAISQIRHLVVTSGWTRDDDQFKRLDLSCARSLTVLGKWSSCFISPSMKLLRVLDLEEVEGLVEHHDLEHIGEFRHLKYLGLRNTGIAHLPKSLGKLHGLEELDIRGTYIAKLPSNLIHLTSLHHLRGGTMAAFSSQQEFDDSEMTRDSPGLLTNAVWSGFCMCLLCLCQRHKPYGVRVPKKIGELKSLLTMGTIDAAGSRTVMKEVQKLAQLRKLGVMGITKLNSKHLCSTLEHLHHLRSLMVHSDDSLSRLDTVASPPHRLETLKLYGSLGTLPRWTKTLHSLRKLCLRSTLLDGDAVQVIARLPKLIVLRLLAKSLVVEEIAFPSGAFPKLELLRLDQLENLMSLSTQGRALPNLEMLQRQPDQEFDIPSKGTPYERLKRWRQAALVLNADRRFRYTLDLKKEEEKERIRQQIRDQARTIRYAFRFKKALKADRSEIEE
ncbi:Disease resistance protein RPM1 [Panicum miliaceum]|uniref:Disease resistance protein RPM1 n=1 Tax=Panicum miliaceum TaxID=4540 RepID=A0A3L6Q2F4_PANMI|nr:Disease resistance protein RPM1 [Panicum miliaceum]